MKPPEYRCCDSNPKTGFSFIVRLLACLLLCLAVGACAPGRGLPDLPPAVPGAYRLDAGDVVRLITVGDDSLTGEFRISDTGQIALPMLGNVAATGLTPDAVYAWKSRITRQVRDILADLASGPPSGVPLELYPPRDVTPPLGMRRVPPGSMPPNSRPSQGSGRPDPATDPGLRRDSSSPGETGPGPRRRRGAAS